MQRYTIIFNYNSCVVENFVFINSRNHFPSARAYIKLILFCHRFKLFGFAIVIIK
jgi:hypothetical protein